MAEPEDMTPENMKSGPNSLKAVIDHLTAQEKKTPSLTTKEKRARTVARLVLVQALYQMEITGTGVESVIREFSDYRFDADLDEGEHLAQADEAFFGEGARAVVKDQDAIDRLVTGRLASGW